MIADDTNNNKNKVARKVNLYHRRNPKRTERKCVHRRTSVGGGGRESTGCVSIRFRGMVAAALTSRGMKKVLRRYCRTALGWAEVRKWSHPEMM
jgi:hypothetical protein